ncbi:MAG: hypothetical protein ABI780_03000 [Ardenticatenales bacterium]
MRRMFTTAALTATLTAAAFAFSTHAAQADSGVLQYKDAMRDFTPAISVFTNESQAFGDVAVTKPELACTDEAIQLAKRARFMVGDLAGTAAPEAMIATQSALGDALAEISAGMYAGCGSRTPLAATLAPAIAKAQRALIDIDLYVNDGIVPGAGPAPAFGGGF